MDQTNTIITNKLSINDWIKLIKYFYVFDDENGVNMLFVTHEDRVYGVGSNSWGSLGLGHNQYVSEPQEILELRHKKICNFVNGEEFIVCQSSDHMIYSCGFNRYGQLGVGDVNEIYVKSMKIEINSNNDFIKSMSCGNYHTLVLTRNNKVYGWGLNRTGQVGSRDTTCWAVNTPERVDFGGDYVIKSVYCFEVSSFALTSDGQVFSWGDNGGKILGHTVSFNRLIALID
jgi:alpha-tubulin suppressor-like RCC1 family protein